MLPASAHLGLRLSNCRVADRSGERLTRFLVVLGLNRRGHWGSQMGKIHSIPPRRRTELASARVDIERHAIDKTVSDLLLSSRALEAHEPSRARVIELIEIALASADKRAKRPAA
jgi:hypothetical protein